MPHCVHPGAVRHARDVRLEEDGELEKDKHERFKSNCLQTSPKGHPSRIRSRGIEQARYAEQEAERMPSVVLVSRVFDGENIAG